MTKAAGSEAGWGVVHVALEIPILAKPDRVWKGLTKDIDKWWPREFLAGPAKKFRFEAKLGGRVYEDWGGGNGIVWYNIIGIEENKSALLRGTLTPAFGGPATSLVEIVLQTAGGGTNLVFTDTIFGAIGVGNGEKTKEGWLSLLDVCLRKHVEAK